MIELERRAGKAANDSRLLREAAGEYCLLLNEDAELMPGAAAALVAALEEDPGAGAAGAQLRVRRGQARPAPGGCRRGPGAGGGHLHPVAPGESRAAARGGARWAGASRAPCSCGAAAAEQVGYLDPDFFVYSDETDFCKRLRDAGWRMLYVPAAGATHHEAVDRPRGRDAPAGEFHRNRDLYMRKHHTTAARLLPARSGWWAYL